MRSVIVCLVALLGLILPTFSTAVTLETARYLPHTAGNQWSYINNSYATRNSNYGSPVTLPSGAVAIPLTSYDNAACVLSCVTYNTFDANGWLRYQEYIGSVYISGYGYTSATSGFAPALSIAPANVTTGSTYTSTGAVTITYTNVTTVTLNYSSTTQIVGFETVSNNAGSQSWSALKVNFSVTMSGTVNGQFLTLSSASTYWLVEGLGVVKAYTPNASGAMETWKLTSTNVEIPKASQNIGTISFSSSSLTVGDTTTASANATSGLTVSYSSVTPSICTVSGSTVTSIASGVCTIAANQMGDTNYNAAAQVTQNITSTIQDQVVEFYNINLDNYFITSGASEAAQIDGGSAGPGWIRTGYNFMAGGSISVCRFYGSQSPGPNSHFYTADAGECDYLKQLQASTPDTEMRWNYEGIAMNSTIPTNGTCPPGTIPVYRAYNNGSTRGVDSNHRITSSLTAIQEVVSRGWSNEGVVMCAPN